MKNISKDKLKKYERSFNQSENKVITNAVIMAFLNLVRIMMK